MMTYKEALQESLETFQTERIEFEKLDGTHVVQESMKALPITFGYFMRSMSVILLYAANELMKIDVGDIYVGESKVASGKIENPSIKDFANIIVGNDFGRGTMLSVQLQGFIEWLLEQKTEDEDLNNMWYSRNELGRKWNEYALQKNLWR